MTEYPQSPLKLASALALEDKNRIEKIRLSVINEMHWHPQYTERERFFWTRWLANSHSTAQHIVPEMYLTAPPFTFPGRAYPAYREHIAAFSEFAVQKINDYIQTSISLSLDLDYRVDISNVAASKALHQLSPAWIEEFWKRCYNAGCKDSERIFPRNIRGQNFVTEFYERVFQAEAGSLRAKLNSQ